MVMEIAGNTINGSTGELDLYYNEAFATDITTRGWTVTQVLTGTGSGSITYGGSGLTISGSSSGTSGAVTETLILNSKLFKKNISIPYVLNIQPQSGLGVFKIYLNDTEIYSVGDNTDRNWYRVHSGMVSISKDTSTTWRCISLDDRFIWGNNTQPVATGSAVDITVPAGAAKLKMVFSYSGAYPGQSASASLLIKEIQGY